MYDTFVMKPMGCNTHNLNYLTFLANKSLKWSDFLKDMLKSQTSYYNLFFLRIWTLLNKHNFWQFGIKLLLRSHMAVLTVLTIFSGGDNFERVWTCLNRQDFAWEDLIVIFQVWAALSYLRMIFCTRLFNPTNVWDSSKGQ